MNINSDMLAMPQEWESYPQAAPIGLTKREHFAGLAMQGLLASGKFQVDREMVLKAWNAADNLLYTQRLQELEK